MNCGATLKSNCCINSHSIIGHDISVGEHAVVSSMVTIGGATVVGEKCYIGIGAQLKDKIIIGKESIVGMGSIVHYDLQEQVIALGNPARVMRRNDEKKVFK